MNKIKNHFKLEDKATEDEILNSITELETNINDGETKLSDALAKITALEEKNSALTNDIAASIVDSAIEAGKIEKGKKDIWLDAAKKDPTAVKAQLDSVTIQTSVQNLFGDKKPADKTPAEIIAWHRSPEGGKKMIELFDTDKDEYERLFSLYEEATK